MCDNAVKAVAEGLAGRAGVAAGDGLLDGGDAGVAGLDGGAAPIEAARFEALARGEDGLARGRGIDAFAVAQEFFVGEQEKGLSAGGGAAAAGAGVEQRGEAVQLLLEGGGQFAKAAGRPGPVPLARAVKYVFTQFLQAAPRAGDHGDDGHAQLGGEGRGVDRLAVLLGDIDHVQGEDGGMADFDDLGGKIEVALQVGGVNNNNDEGRRRHAGRALKQDVAGDLFIEGLRAEAVGSREIEDDDAFGAGALEAAFLAFDGDAGIIADAGAQTGEGVEHGGFAGIGVAGEDDLERRLGCGRPRRSGRLAPHRPGVCMLVIRRRGRGFVRRPGGAR